MTNKKNNYEEIYLNKTLSEEEIEEIEIKNTSIRVMRYNSAYTCECRPNRINLILDSNGIVVRITRG